MKQFKKLFERNEQGFTIIETLIVLAVAATIIFLVFYAVPGLQRNSRNNSYRSEATRVLSGANELLASNGGTKPTAGTTTIASGVCTPATSDGCTILKNANVKNIGSIVIVDGAGTRTPATNFSQVILNTGVTCGAAAGAGYSTIAGSQQSFVLVYQTENNTGGPDGQCQSS